MATKNKKTNRNSPCPCGSGIRYRKCCGKYLVSKQLQENIYTPDGYYAVSLMDKENRHICSDQPESNKSIDGIEVPPGVLVLDNFLGPDDCKRIQDYADRTVGKTLKIQDVDKSSSTRFEVKDSDTRITEYVPLGELQPEIIQTFDKICIDKLNPYYGVSIEWYAIPGILRYRPGGRYDLHADSENWDYEENRWVRGMDRDYSAILYFNSDYTGGDLFFPNFEFRLHPKPGMLVIFPSDHRYMHVAETVESGKRHCLVSWFTAKGTQRVFNKAPPGSRILPEEIIKSE